MNYKSWRLIGVLAIIGAVISLAIFAGMSGGESYIRKNFKSVGTNTYRCEGDPKAVADQIAKNVRPKARATDSQTGEHFMRYSDKIVRVSGRGYQVRNSDGIRQALPLRWVHLPWRVQPLIATWLVQWLLGLWGRGEVILLSDAAIAFPSHTLSLSTC